MNWWWIVAIGIAAWLFWPRRKPDVRPAPSVEYVPGNKERAAAAANDPTIPQSIPGMVTWTVTDGSGNVTHHSQPVTTYPEQTYSAAEERSLGLAYASIWDSNGRMHPASREDIEAHLVAARGKLPDWKRLHTRALKAVERAWQTEKPNPRLRSELEAVLPEIQATDDAIRAFLDTVSFRDTRSDAKYHDFWEKFVEISCDLEQALDSLKDMENPSEMN